MQTISADLKRVVAVVAILNLAYFGIELAVAQRIGSVSLFADSVDFFEDAAVNFLILASLGWSQRARARVGMALAGVLMIPALAALWTIISKVFTPVAPDAFSLSLTGAGALVINSFCALVLERYRDHAGSVTRAAFLSARNDVFANIAIILAGAITAYLWRSVWPDIIVGLGIAALNAGAAHEIWEEACEEHAQA